MASFFTLTLDTSPPASPTITINGAAPFTGSTQVFVTLSTADYSGGSQDVTHMRLWGDVDPSVDPSVQAVEPDSAWIPFTETVPIRLSSDAGRKRLYARLRDDVCNQTVEFTTFIDYDPAIPVVRITTPVSRSRISKVDPCDETTFVWESDAVFAAYEVRVVPSVASPHTTGVPLGTTFGSSGVAGAGSFGAAVPVTTTITGSDLEAASPGDAPKVIKVFVRTAAGAWSV